MRVLDAQRDGMEARDVEALPMPEHLRADERDVEIARSGAVCVERCAIAPARAGDSAAAQDDFDVGRRYAAECGNERFESVAVTREGEPNDAVDRTFLARGVDDGRRRRARIGIHRCALGSATSGPYSLRDLVS